MLSSSSSSSPSPRRRRARASASKSLARAPPRVEVADNTRPDRRAGAPGAVGRGRARHSHGVRNTRNASSRDAIGQKTSRKVKKTIATRAPGRSNSRARASVCQAVGLSVLSVRPVRPEADARRGGADGHRTRRRDGGSEGEN